MSKSFKSLEGRTPQTGVMALLNIGMIKDFFKTFCFVYTLGFFLAEVLSDTYNLLYFTKFIEDQNKTLCENWGS